MLNWEEFTLPLPVTQECIWSTLPCCLVTWEWLNNYGAAVTSAVFPILIYILSRRHTPNRLRCSRLCFSSNFNSVFMSCHTAQLQCEPRSFPFYLNFHDLKTSPEYSDSESSGRLAKTLIAGPQPQSFW